MDKTRKLKIETDENSNINNIKKENIHLNINHFLNENNNIDSNIDSSSPNLIFESPLNTPTPRSLKKKPKSYIKKIRSSPSFQSIPLTKSISNLSVNSLNKFNLQNENEEETLKYNSFSQFLTQSNNDDDDDNQNIGYLIEDDLDNKNELKESQEEDDFFDQIEKNQYSEPKQFLIKKVKKHNQKKNNEESEIDEKESIFTTSTNKSSKNQLFHENPPYELVKEIMKIFLGDNLNNPCYQFTRKMIEEKRIIEKIETYIPELKKYYLKCKQGKYLENLDSKKIITIFRQLIRIYGYQVHSTEKYQNGSKFLLYKIDKIEKMKEQNKNHKKSNFTVDFD